MRKLRRHLSLAIPVVFALFAAGCAIETPYPGWRSPAPPAGPLWVREVIELVQSGTAEELIIERARENGIAARPTAREVNALRKAGASDRLMATLLSAALLDPAECPPMPSIEFQFYLWQPYPPFPGFVPIPGWHWLEGRGPSVPRPERLEP